MKLRQYRNEDAQKILSWIKSEREFRLWSADRYKEYPASPDDINNNYSECEKDGAFYPFTLEDNGKTIGHLILREPEKGKRIIRMGFIIVDNGIRGKGYGKILIREAIKYAEEELLAEEINLGVFTKNEGALHCYQSVGFKTIRIDEKAYNFHGEDWNCAEMILRK